jgi:hypothetical protein
MAKEIEEKPKKKRRQLPLVIIRNDNFSTSRVILLL